MAVALQATEPYQGGSAGTRVKWVFEGITELLPIYEELEDDSKIMWVENKPRKLRNLREKIKSFEELTAVNINRVPC